MNKELLVLQALKPRVKALGFNKNELKGVAAKIANNLNLEDEATEDVVNAAIDEAIDAVMPFLEVTQQVSSRVINDYKKTTGKPVEDEDDEDETESTQPKKPKQPKKDETPEWAKILTKQIEKLDAELTAVKAEKTSASRKDKLSAVLKDAGSYGNRTLKNFAKMKFESDEEFEDFLEGVQADLEAYNQEQANRGLGKLGGSPNTGKGAEKNELLTDDEIKVLANL